MAERVRIPRLVVAALKGGAGKTLITMGLVSLLRSLGRSVSVFKKGPDYIDAGWIGLAAGRDCFNLDAYLFQGDVLLSSFIARSRADSVAVIEGNRGLFDGVDATGTYSTAELAKSLRAPVVLIFDATKVTRTAAALVLGCRELEPDLDLRAVILNRVAGTRHERILRESVEDATGIPVIGSVRKLPFEDFPQRHLGLLPLQEHPRAREFVREAERVVADSVDPEPVLAIAESAPDLEVPAVSSPLDRSQEAAQSGLRIGVLRDSAFQFYYPENLEALTRAGALVVEINTIEAESLPRLDGLYIGGGFPETHAELLAGNRGFRESLRDAVREGLPVYAECGGLMYLSESLRIDERVYPMVGVFPAETVLERKPQGHGYLRVEVAGPNPFYPQGTVLSGHEFHYSYVRLNRPAETSYAFRVIRGHGIDGSRDGICSANALGTYLHVHALGEPLWAKGIVEAAARYRKSRSER